jgi:hypothetical protein
MRAELAAIRSGRLSTAGGNLMYVIAGVKPW